MSKLVDLFWVYCTNCLPGHCAGVQTGPIRLHGHLNRSISFSEPWDLWTNGFVLKIKLLFPSLAKMLVPEFKNCSYVIIQQSILRHTHLILLPIYPQCLNKLSQTMVVGLNSHFTLYHHEKWLVKQSPLSLRKSTMSHLIAGKSPCHIPYYVYYIYYYIVFPLYTVYPMIIYYISYTVLFFFLWSVVKTPLCYRPRGWKRPNFRRDHGGWPPMQRRKCNSPVDETWHWELITLSFRLTTIKSR